MSTAHAHAYDEEEFEGGEEAAEASVATPESVPRTSGLGEFLVDRGVIDHDLLEEALAVQSREAHSARRKLGEILVEDLGQDRHTVYRAVAEAYAFREVDLSQERFDDTRVAFIRKLMDSLTSDVRAEFIRRKLLPFRVEDDANQILLVSTPDPTDRRIPGLLRHLSTRRCEVVYSRLEQVEEILETVAPPKGEFMRAVSGGEEAPEIQVSNLESEKLDEEALDAEIHRSHLTNLVEGCVVEAVRQGASDIHIIPKGERETEFYFRIDGKLELWFTQSDVKPEAVAAVFKDRCRNVDRFERERAQDGFFQRVVDDHLIRFRASVLPIVGRMYERKLESVVIRVLDDRKTIVDLDQLGLQGPTREKFVKAITRPQGLVILTGPTGCGKTTTLHAALHHVQTSQVNVLTVEDPVEYLLDGARQIKINSRLDFEGAVRAILRHDPDIVMVGEMRDKITAEIAIKLANTGHVTFSTLHTNDAPSAVSRLFKMGIEPFLIANAINIVVAQRLVRRLCDSCKEEVDAGAVESLARSLGMADEEILGTTFYRAHGCRRCKGGYAGRTAIHEALYFSPEIQRLIVDAGNDIDEESIRSLAIQQGMMTLRASGLHRVRTGTTSLEEVAQTTSAA